MCVCVCVCVCVPVCVFKQGRKGSQNTAQPQITPFNINDYVCIEIAYSSGPRQFWFRLCHHYVQVFFSMPLLTRKPLCFHNYTILGLGSPLNPLPPSLPIPSPTHPQILGLGPRPLPTLHPSYPLCHGSTGAVYVRAEQTSRWLISLCCTHDQAMGGSCQAGIVYIYRLTEEPVFLCEPVWPSGKALGW